MNRLLKILDQSAAVRTKQSALSSLTLMQSANAHLSLLGIWNWRLIWGSQGPQNHTGSLG